MPRSNLQCAAFARLSHAIDSRPKLWTDIGFKYSFLPILWQAPSPNSITGIHASHSHLASPEDYKPNRDASHGFQNSAHSLISELTLKWRAGVKHQLPGDFRGNVSSMILRWGSEGRKRVDTHTGWESDPQRHETDGLETDLLDHVPTPSPGSVYRRSDQVDPAHVVADAALTKF